MKNINAIKLPPFLKGTSVTEKDREKYIPEMTNWHKCRRYVNTQNLTVPLMAKLMVIEMNRELPREGMLRNLLQTFNSARRNEAIRQLDDFLKMPGVTDGREIDHEQPELN